MSNKDAIKQLTTREQCREKLPIFFGSRDNFVHGLKELVANSIDEISNNFKNGIITVEVFDDLQTISVKDTGRGIPINKVTDGKPNYELLFETLFAGTNYDNNNNGKIAVGTNGCGTCVLNHSSSLFDVEVARDGKIFNLRYINGGNKQYFREVGESNEHYTKITFKLDDGVYTQTTYNIDEIRDICKYNSAVNNKVTIIFKHKDEETKFHYDSIEDYFQEMCSNNTTKEIVGTKGVYEGDETNEIECILSTSSNPTQYSFLNSNYMPNGGTVNDGVVNGVKNFINKYCKENKLLDKKIGNIINSDVEESISFVCSVNSTNVEYENQTKLSTNKSLYKTLVQKYVVDMLDVELKENPNNIKKMANHILEVQKFNNKATNAKKALKKKLNEKVDGLNNRIKGLVDCKEHGEDSELFIAEGKSALGSIVLARNPKNQAVIAIRGKILNCLKADIATIFDNEIVLDLIKCLGCGIETDKKNKDLGEFNMNSLRFGKIILATDSDADGENIQCLLLTMFYKLTPKLISEGKIYIMKTPLYEVVLNDDEVVYYFTEKEKEEGIKKLKNIKHINRAKGLGELDSEIMDTFGVNPNTRHITKVTIDSIEKMIESFEIFMDDDVSLRKPIIEQELNKYVDID